MQDEQGYNGWKNYPTWAVALWIGNDEGLYDESVRLTRDILAETESRSEFWTLDQSHRYALADELKSWVRDSGDLIHDGDLGMGGDLLGWALDQVDWNEIAAHYVADFVEVEA